jgi:alanyl-tRNA synthetase
VAPGVWLVSFAGPFESIDALKGVAKDVRGSLPSGVIALGLEADEPAIFVTASDDLVGRGVSAGDLVREAMPAIDGRGGGRPEMAQGKGTRADGLDQAMEAIRTALTKAG